MCLNKKHRFLSVCINFPPGIPFDFFKLIYFMYCFTMNTNLAQKSVTLLPVSRSREFSLSKMLIIIYVFQSTDFTYSLLGHVVVLSIANVVRLTNSSLIYKVPDLKYPTLRCAIPFWAPGKGVQCKWGSAPGKGKYWIRKINGGLLQRALGVSNWEWTQFRGVSAFFWWRDFKDFWWDETVGK